MIHEWRSIYDFEDIINKVDICIVTAPLTEETRGLVSKAFLSKMKKECLFVNVSRGGIVNTKDLLCSIQDGTISGAILDVFEEEPLPSDSPLWNCDRLMISRIIPLRVKKI